MIRSNAEAGNVSNASLTYRSDQMANSPVPGATKWKRRPAGKLEDIARDLTSKTLDLRQSLLELGGVKDDQRRRTRGVPRAFRSVEAARHSPVIESDVVRSIILERPAEERGEEVPGRGEITGRHLDIINRFWKRFVHFLFSIERRAQLRRDPSVVRLSRTFPQAACRAVGSALSRKLRRETWR